MSTVRLRCDDCGTKRQGEVGQSIEALRKKLRAVGWRTSSVYDTDECPRCRAGVRTRIREGATR